MKASKYYGNIKKLLARLHKFKKVFKTRQLKKKKLIMKSYSKFISNGSIG